MVTLHGSAVSRTRGLTSWGSEWSHILSVCVIHYVGVHSDDTELLVSQVKSLSFSLCSQKSAHSHLVFPIKTQPDRFIYFQLSRMILVTFSFSPDFNALPWLVQALSVCNCIVCWYDLVTQSQRHWHCGCGLHGHVRGIKSTPRAAAHNIFKLCPLEQEVLA